MALFDSNRIITNKMRLINAQQLFDDVYSSSANSGLYMFTGQASPWTSNNVITPPDSSAKFSQAGVPDNTTNESINDYQNMIFGKQITAADISIVIPRYDWTQGTVYAHYIHDNANLFNEQFYVGVNQGASYDVFLCIDNNNELPSTIPPNLADTSAGDSFYQTSDGYQWKYMYSIPISSFNKFATSNFIPVIPNANVSGNAVSGSIDLIDVANSGTFYNNYFSGQFNFSDIQVSGNPLSYNISNTASSNNNFYANSIMVITNGKGAGQFRTITGYTVSGNTKIANINTAFTTIPDITSTYDISPIVIVTGDGNQTLNCIARAIVNSAASNSVYKTEILQGGAGYRIATATIGTSNVIPSNGAVIVPIISPPGGHGFDVNSELGGTRIVVGISFANNENGTITTSNKYSQVGIIKDPVFANVSVNILNSIGGVGSNGTFLSAETVYQMVPIFLSGTVSVNSISSTITGYSSSNTATGTYKTDFKNSLKVGNYIYLTSGANAFITQVTSIANSTYMTIQSNSFFSSNTANLAIASVTASSVVSNVAGGVLNVSNVSGQITQGAILVGNSSGAVATVNNYSITGQNKTFATFNQLISFDGSLVGSFIPGEVVTQPTTSANGYVHSYDGSRLYLTNVFGTISANGTLVGANSSAVFTITNKYNGDLVIDSGKILFIEDLVQGISRANNQTETTKIVLEY